MTITRYPEVFPSERHLDIRQGLVGGQTAGTQLGHADALTTTLRHIHHEMATADLDIKALYDTPATVKVSSTDTNDDGSPAGTGAQTVLITGVDSSGVAQSETVTLDGTTEVTSTGTYKAVTGLTVTAVGSGGSNAGVIWAGNGVVTSGVPATKYQSVEVGTNASRGSHFYVYSGQRFHPTQLFLNLSDTSKDLDVRISFYNGSVEYEIFDIHLTGADALRIPVVAFPPVAADTLVMTRASVDTGTAVITSVIAGIYEEI
jgi:hypothetical protein